MDDCFSFGEQVISIINPKGCTVTKTEKGRTRSDGFTEMRYKQKVKVIPQKPSTTRIVFPSLCPVESDRRRDRLSYPLPKL